MHSQIKNILLVILVLLLVLFMTSVRAHEMTPTYPKLVPSHLDGIVKADMRILNKRHDVEYYEIGVFDKDWKPVPFVSVYKMIHIKYLKRLQFSVYIHQEDAKKAEYICSKSKVRGDLLHGTVLSSRICSRFK